MSKFRKLAQALDEVDRCVRESANERGGEAGGAGAAGRAERALRSAREAADLLAKHEAAMRRFEERAAETDPDKRIYGDKMCEKIRALAARFHSAEAVVKEALAEAQQAFAPAAAASEEAARRLALSELEESRRREEEARLMRERDQERLAEAVRAVDTSGRAAEPHPRAARRRGGGRRS